jgi:hypothetical protein
VLDGALAARIGGVAVGECGQQRGHDGDDLAAVGELFARFLDEEVRSLAVDGEHRVVLVFGRLGDGLAQHLADRVDGDVDRSDRCRGVGEQARHVRRDGEVGLERGGLHAESLKLRKGLLRIRPRRLRVEVDRDVRPGLGGLPGDQPAEVLRTARDEDVLARQSVLAHESSISLIH